MNKPTITKETLKELRGKLMSGEYAKAETAGAAARQSRASETAGGSARARMQSSAEALSVEDEMEMEM